MCVSLLIVAEHMSWVNVLNFHDIARAIERIVSEQKIHKEMTTFINNAMASRRR